MAIPFRTFLLALGLALAGSMAPAQQRIAFGELNQDTTLPVEVQADQLTVNNADGTAVFSGNVIVTQGEMKLSAGEVRVTYGADRKSIDSLLASGGVTVTNLGDAAEAREALYTIDSGVIVLTGDVVLTQGPSAMAGQKLTINLKDGTGVMEGRVTTTFVPGGN
ncbi:LptA/OstA family protein [Rhodobacter calidifons]|uniref:Lipopolysaccharide transport periplasmic protein LptA n=1 Tax=Rhodobacter calidifons TaxID=2715277 RepID=A0ABX0G4M7_9RHOB|nr:LptA/OstA family protein [Rhodobacter calidifons]NHB75927.1 lipopolysaccharide transport periplasmic protein LptA [Rhodobacter calidifons]